MIQREMFYVLAPGLGTFRDWSPPDHHIQGDKEIQMFAIPLKIFKIMS